MSDRIPMTQEGYNKIKAEVEQLEKVEMPVIAEKIAEARAEGDLKENAEYHGQRERQGMLQAKINLLKSKLANATIVDTSKIPKDEVGFGAMVTVKDLDFDDEEDFTLVGAGLEELQLNGHPTEWHPGNLNVSFAFVEGEALLMALEDIAVSSGSACTTASLEPSHVLKAIGLPDGMAQSSVRFGVGRNNTEEEIDFVIDRIAAEVPRLRAMSPEFRMRATV